MAKNCETANSIILCPLGNKLWETAWCPPRYNSKASGLMVALDPSDRIKWLKKGNDKFKYLNLGTRSRYLAVPPPHTHLPPSIFCSQILFACLMILSQLFKDFSVTMPP